MKIIFYPRYALIIILVIVSQLLYSQDIESGLVAHYSFEETSGTICLDETGNNDGAIYGNPILNQTGKIGKCYLFDGTDDKIELDTIYLGTNKGSIAAWVKTNIITSSKKAIGRYWQSYSLGLDEYGYYNGFFNGSDLSDWNTVQDTAWHFLSITYDGSNVIFYVDGSAKRTISSTASNAHQDEIWEIGTHGSGAGFWSGKIDEVRLYNRALLASEVLSLYNQTNVLALDGGTINANVTTVSLGASPGVISNATLPSGGSGTYTYQWQDSTAGGLWIDISGANLDSLTVPALTEDTWFRREVEDNGSNVAYSNEILITVLSELNGGTISADITTVSSGESPGVISNATLPSGGLGNYTYQWQDSIISGTWTDISGANLDSLVSPTLTENTWFRREVEDNGIIAYSNEILITVLSELDGGTISADITTVSSGESPGIISNVTLPSGGLGNYTYQWQDSTIGGTWTDISGADLDSLVAPTLTESTWFRREVEDNGSFAYSNEIIITVLTGGSTVDWADVLNKPAGFADDVDNVDDDDSDATNEIQQLSISGNILSISGTTSTIDLTGYLDNTNLTESDVDTYVSNNGYLTDETDPVYTADSSGIFTRIRDIEANNADYSSVAEHLSIDNDTSANNEIQTLSLSGNTLSLSDGGQVTLPSSSISINGTPESNQIAVWTGTNSIKGSSSLRIDAEGENIITKSAGNNTSRQSGITMLNSGGVSSFVIGHDDAANENHIYSSNENYPIRIGVGNLNLVGERALISLDGLYLTDGIHNIGATINEFSKDGYMSDNSDTAVPTEKAVKTYVDNAMSGGTAYLGGWNASTNTPTISDASGSQGDMYAVTVTGTQNLGSGSITWTAGGFAIHNGSVFEYIGSESAVVSVNGYTGTIGLYPQLSGNNINISGNSTTIDISAATAVAANTAKETDDDLGVNQIYGSGWNGNSESPEKDDIYDYLHLFDSDDDGSFIDENWYVAGSSGDMIYPSAGIPISTGSGWGTSITNNSSNWNSAYNDKINSAAFNTSTGNLTLTQQDGGTVTVDLDGRYATSSGGGAPTDAYYITKYDDPTLNNDFALSSLDSGVLYCGSGNLSTHQLGIANNYVVSVDQAGGATNGFYARFTALGIEGISKADVKSDLEISGSDVTITDAGGYFSGTNTETILQEMGSNILALSQGGSDDWGNDVVNTDFTLTGDGTSNDLLKVDTTRIATKYDLTQISGGGTDDQTIDVFSFSGTILSLSLEGDGESTKTVDLSSLQSSTGTAIASEVLLSGYSMPFSSTAINANDDIQTAIGKLERGLEDVSPGSSLTYLGLTDTPESFNPNYLLKVNGLGNGIEHVNPNTLNISQFNNDSQYISASGITFNVLNANGIVGNASYQIASGDHNHNHFDDQSNPHNVTHTQVGSENSYWNANKLQGKQISVSDPTIGNVLRWNGAIWAPSDIIPGSNYAQWNANKLQGNPISSTDPTNGQVLKWDGSYWAPGEDNTGGSNIWNDNTSYINYIGKVGINTTDPGTYELAVNGKIHAKEVVVDLDFTAPDYVFEETYNLKSLSEIESYIKEYKHLPEIPSAKEVEEEGVSLAEMNMLLLKKIEELTLHLIEQEKRIKELEIKNNK